MYNELSKKFFMGAAQRLPINVKVPGKKMARAFLSLIFSLPVINRHIG